MIDAPSDASFAPDKALMYLTRQDVNYRETSQPFLPT